MTLIRLATLQDLQGASYHPQMHQHASTQCFCFPPVRVFETFTVSFMERSSRFDKLWCFPANDPTDGPSLCDLDDCVDRPSSHRQTADV